MTPRVIGLDLSLTATGLADFTHRGREVITKTIRSTSNGATAGPQHERLRGIVQEIAEHIWFMGAHPTLIVVEGPSYGSKGAGTWDRAGLWWLVVDHILNQRNPRIPLAVVPPAVLKKYATGRGNADKTAMAVAVQKRWGVELGDDNKVDAWWLGAAGRDRLGMPFVDLPKAQREALDKVTWPEVNA
jgi:Holliday junction resolvasome RuvABC endonuclease subunit